MQHTSDCATHNEPALPVSACDCSARTAYIKNPDPVWQAIWNTIRGWDISRTGAVSYHAPTGDDATAIYEAVLHAQRVDDEPRYTTGQIAEGLKFAKEDIDKLAFALSLHVPLGTQGGRHDIDGMVYRAKSWIDTAIRVLDTGPRTNMSGQEICEQPTV